MIAILACKITHPALPTLESNATDLMLSAHLWFQALVSTEETLQNEILCKLTECGADLALQNNEGKTPLSLCKAPELKQQLLR